MNIHYLKNFTSKKDKKWKFKSSEGNLSGKQKLSIGVLLLSISYITVLAQSSGVHSTTMNIKTISEIVDANSKDMSAGPYALLSSFFVSALGFVDIIKNTIGYIVNAQMSTTSVVAGAKFGSAGMFSHVSNGITIFAVIACGYKILMHYLKTERYDNVQAFTGFFSYVGTLFLFLFSGQIVNRLASLNSSINQSAISSIGTKINNEIDQQINTDWQTVRAKLEKLQTDYESSSSAPAKTNDSGIFDKTNSFLDKLDDLPKLVKNRSDYYSETLSFYGGSIGKYVYFGVFGIILTSILAIPSFVMTLMVKILLSVMIFGAKIVFLLAFIPGFENSWKSFMLNFLNILLWVPIFNAIISFILQIVSATMITGSMTGGQIIWLCLVSIICAYQSISLTTTAAGVIINGAGAGMAGAMGALSSFSAAGMAGQAASTAAGFAGSAVSGGAGVAAANKLKK